MRKKFRPGPGGEKLLVPVPAGKSFRSRSRSLQKQILVPVPVKKNFGPDPGQKKKFGHGPSPDPGQKKKFGHGPSPDPGQKKKFGHGPSPDPAGTTLPISSTERS